MEELPRSPAREGSTGTATVTSLLVLLAMTQMNKEPSPNLNNVRDILLVPSSTLNGFYLWPSTTGASGR